MKAKNVLYRVFCSSFMAAGSMYAFNKFHSIYALKNHILTSSPENYFKWNGERIYYNCIGKGEPVLLLHALHPAASAEEWQLITESLSKDHKVFVLDLPGCGRSSKSRLKYTGYYYIKLIEEFMNAMALSEIPVVASNLTSAIAIMASAYDPSLFSKIVLISPPSISVLSEKPDFISKLKNLFLEMPISGTFIYKLLCSKPQIDLAFTEQYFYNPFHDTDDLVDTYFESSQIGDGKGHYFAGRMLGKYIHIDVSHVLTHFKTPVKIIEGAETNDGAQVITEWTALNPRISVSEIEHTKKLPHMEEPELTVREICSFIDESDVMNESN